MELRKEGLLGLVGGPLLMKNDKHTAPCDRVHQQCLAGGSCTGTVH